QVVPDPHLILEVGDPVRIERPQPARPAGRPAAISRLAGSRTTPARYELEDHQEPPCFRERRPARSCRTARRMPFRRLSDDVRGDRASASRLLHTQLLQLTAVGFTCKFSLTDVRGDFVELKLTGNELLARLTAMANPHRLRIIAELR